MNPRPTAYKARLAVAWTDYREWLYGKYSKTWARGVFNLSRKYHYMICGNLRDLDSFSKWKRNNTLKALIALSKYLGIYEQFKAKIKGYGIKWENQSSVESFLRMMNRKDGLMDWVKKSTNVLDKNLSTFIEFVMLSGIRRGEAINAFNLLIRLNKTGKLSSYYNSDLQSLEHFRFEDTFMRRTKNVFFTFLPKTFINRMTMCDPISYTTLKRRLKEHNLKLRLNELRDHYATFMVHNGLIREEVDILQGRIGKSLFMRHYFSPNIAELKGKVLRAIGVMTNKAELKSLS